MYQCQLGVHCRGAGRIQVHVVEFNTLVCVKCAAGEEGISQARVREAARDPEISVIHYARSINHECR